MKEPRKLDWNEYTSWYSDRYIKPSESDSIIYDKLPKHIDTAIDVGGGVRGTYYLKADKHLLLDPYVKSSLQTIDWDDVNPNCADVIIARGSINYLTEQEIKKLIKALRGGGVFAFNTFATPKTGRRRYFNSYSGSGVEYYKFVEDIGEYGSIEHTLEPDMTNWKIVHTFYYYPHKVFLNLALDECCSLTTVHNNNTDIHFVRR